MSTLPFAGPVDDLLSPFDPTRTRDHWWEHLELHAAADPKVAAARKLLESRLGSLPEADVEAVATLFWGLLRLRLRAGVRPNRFRMWLADGDRVLATVQDAVELLLAPAALTDLARRVRALDASDAPDTDELSVAKGEVQQAVSTDFGPATVLAFAAGYGLAHLAIEAEAAIHGHGGLEYHGPHHL